MNDQLTQMAVSLLLLALQSTSSRNKFKRAFLKIFNAIGEVYMMDRDFKAGVTVHFPEPDKK